MLPFLALAGLLTIINFPQVSANADDSTGYLPYVCPSDKWLKENSADHINSGIQASECGKNTRLHFPKVQMYAYFKTNHAMDHYHGCPYGVCFAYQSIPTVDDLVIDPDCISFTWHGKGGFAGLGVRPIANPQTGQNGYEESLTGKYRDGKAKATDVQPLHDLNYPTFAKVNATSEPWPKDIADQLGLKKLPNHQPKCGRPCEINLDPGVARGAPREYVPARAIEYYNSAPTHAKGWPQCPVDRQGKVVFSNPIPNPPGGSYCHDNPDAETCHTSATSSKPSKPDCGSNPEAEGCGGSSEEPDCNANPKAEGCPRSKKNPPHCASNPQAEGCGGSSEQPDCNANPEAKGCPRSKKNPPHCASNPEAEGCGGSSEQPDCNANPEAKGCPGAKEAGCCKSNPQGPGCSGKKPKKKSSKKHPHRRSAKATYAKHRRAKRVKRARALYSI